jgi:hypothetical protein
MLDGKFSNAIALRHFGASRGWLGQFDVRGIEVAESTSSANFDADCRFRASAVQAWTQLGLEC